MLKSTILSHAASFETLTGKAIAFLELNQPGGLAIEIAGRLAALAVIDGHDEPAALTKVYKVFADFVSQGVQPLPKVLTAWLNDNNKILYPAGADAADAVVAVHGIIKDVIDGNVLTVDKIPPDVSPIPVTAADVVAYAKAKPGSIKPSLEGAGTEVTPLSATATLESIATLDLDTFLDDVHEPLRPMITRTLAHFYPEAFKIYREVKDSGTATAKRDAYAFALTAFRKLIGTGVAK